MLNSQRLQALRSVVSANSVTAAANSLGYTPSAVSQQIAALERDVGTTLIERVGRGIRPTPAGRLLSEHAATIEAQMATAITELADLEAGRVGTIRIATINSLGASLIPNALRTLREAHPQHQIELRLAEADTAINAVIRSDVDVAIVVDDRLRSGPDIDTVGLLEDPYLVVLPKGHALADQEAIALHAIAHEPLISSASLDGPCHRPVADAFDRAAITPNIALETDDFGVAMGLVAAGLGLSLLPRLGLISAHPDVTVRPLSDSTISRPIAAVIRRRDREHLVYTTLLNALRPQ